MNREDFLEYKGSTVRVTYQSRMMLVARSGILLRVSFRNLTLVSDRTGFTYSVPIVAITGIIANVRGG